MYATIRRYKVNPGTEAEITKLINEEFVPIISKGPGFIAYYFVDAGNGVLATVSIFQDQAGAEESNAKAADWVKQSIASFISDAPEITAGEVAVQKTV